MPHNSIETRRYVLKKQAVAVITKNRQNIYTIVSSITTEINMSGYLPRVYLVMIFSLGKGIIMSKIKKQ
jgi:hypothetical protein